MDRYRMFSLKSICNNIQVDKASINKINNKSSIHSKSMKYASYVNPKSGNYKTITEGQVTTITMTYATPNTATIAFTYVSNPLYFEMAIVNIQDTTDRQMVEMYSSPYTFTNLKPNSYYTITTYATFVSTNTYTKVFPSAIKTLHEGPPTNIMIQDILYNSAIISFTIPIGNPTYVNLTLLTTTNTDTLFYPEIKSPFLITGLQPDITYDISICSFYSSTQNTYSVYKVAAFETFDENYPIINSITNITNMGVTINYEYTGAPTYNSIQLINANDSTNTYMIKDTDFLKTVTFDKLHIDSSYNLILTSLYNTGHIFPVNQPNAFHTFNEDMIAGASVYSILGKTITFKLSPAVGNVVSYIVALTDINGNVTSHSYTSAPEYVVFSNLDANTNYRLTVISNYLFNSYTYQYPGYIQTLNEGPVTDISYSNVLNTSAQISFTPSPGSGMTYNITYKGQRNDTTRYSINGQQTTVVSLNNLSIYAYGYPISYSFYVNDVMNGIYIGLANTQQIYTLSGLSTGMSYTISIVTEYASNRSYTTTWPMAILL